jgi:hypothetical protein
MRMNEGTETKKVNRLSIWEVPVEYGFVLDCSRLESLVRR